MQNRFAALESVEFDNIQQRYDHLVESIEESAKEVLGVKKGPKAPNWVSENTLQLREHRDNAKKAYLKRRSQDKYKTWKDLCDQVDVSYQADHESQLDNKAKELDTASKQGKLKRVWEIVNDLSGKTARKIISVKLLDGSNPKSPTDELNDWAKYFESVLNNNFFIPDQESLPKPASKDLESIEINNFSRIEIDIAIDHLRDNKATGLDNVISAEALKHGEESLRAQIHEICNQVYESNMAPSQWKSSILVPVPKKGNLQLMTNYRGISLMSILAKVYNTVLLNRIRPTIDKLLRPNQAGFRQGRSCAQQIHILRRLFEGAKSRNIPLYVTFIDFKKAFDSINRVMMFAILRHYGIPEKIVNAIKTLYDESSTRVFVKGQISKEFKVSAGVLQGDVLAPFLFIIVNARDSKLIGPFEPIRRYALYEPSPGLSISKKKSISTKEILYTKYIANMLIPDKKLAKEIKYTATEIESAAQNRIQWKMRVNACKAAGD